MSQYEGIHREPTPEAAERCDYLDNDVKSLRWAPLFPCRHYRARHTTQPCKVPGCAA